jgi:hypothetical protein
MRCLLPLPLAGLCFMLQAQPQLPGLTPADTLTRSCPGDSTMIMLSFDGWEAYQTFDGTWNGPIDPGICIELVAIAPSGWVYPRIEVDAIDQARPVFIRVRFEDDFVLPLATDNPYNFPFDLWSLAGWDTGDRQGGPCTGTMAAERRPVPGLEHRGAVLG